jgi:hypothetical protein
MIWKQREARPGAVSEPAPTEPRHYPGGSNRRQSPWPRASGEQSGLAVRLPTAYFDSLGIPDGWKRFRLTERNRRMRTRMSWWCSGGERATAPPMPIFAVKQVVRKAIQF